MLRNANSLPDVLLEIFGFVQKTKEEMCDFGFLHVVKSGYRVIGSDFLVEIFSSPANVFRVGHGTENIRPSRPESCKS